MPSEAQGPATIALVVCGSISPGDVVRLAGRVETLLRETEADLVVYAVGALAAPDAVTIDAVGRLILAARRLGRGVRLEEAPPHLQELLEFMGLRGIVSVPRSSSNLPATPGMH